MNHEIEQLIAELTLVEPSPRVKHWIEEAPEPEFAAAQLLRWLRECANASTAYSIVAESGSTNAGSGMSTGKCFITLLGSSHFLSDVLVQNAQLASLILTPELLTESPEIDQIIAEGRRMFAHSSSPSHRLDQLRYLKQTWMLRLTACDLFEFRSVPDTLLALSNLAEALINLTFESVWQEFCVERDLTGPCPISVVAFGKLGGSELNYSSDIDLVYALADGADELVEKEMNRFAARLNRALSEHMGRGALYRVDNRLRPFGSSGPLVAKFGAIESYYQNYAEPWEVMALIRSRVVAGQEGDRDRWEALRQKTCFGKTRGQWFVEEILQMRKKIEGHSEDCDIKRGPGGIRDIEFAVQLHQVILGHTHPGLRAMPTLVVAAQLSKVEPEHAERWTSLAQTYTYFRKIEHALQLVDDRQTHQLPQSDEAWTKLGKVLNEKSIDDLRENLDAMRVEVRNTYVALVGRFDQVPDVDLDNPFADLPSASVETIRQWFKSMPDPEQFIRTLASNPSTKSRVKIIASRAPGWCMHLRQDLATTEAIISGEIEERTSWKESGAVTASRIQNKVGTQFILESIGAIGGEVCAAIDAVLTDLVRDAHPSISLIAMGSYAACDMSLASDVDCMLLTAEKDPTSDIFLSAKDVLKRAQERGIKLDLRLRPDGGRGEIVRSYEAMLQYEVEGMEPWERMAWSRSRLVHGHLKAFNLVRQAAFNLKFDAKVLADLVAMKKRIENERVSPSVFWREVKLGAGGLLDIEWTLQLLIWRYIDRVGPDVSANTGDRIHLVRTHEFLTESTADTLLRAWRHHRNVRDWLSILRFQATDQSTPQTDPEDVIPENPDKLDHLANLLGQPNSNAFLQEDIALRKQVRGIYEHTLTRL